MVVTLGGDVVNDGMHDSLVLAALWRLSDADAARHLAECEAFNLWFRAGLGGTSDLLHELQMEAFGRRYPEVGEVDPTWLAWAAWVEVAVLRQRTAAMEG